MLRASGVPVIEFRASIVIGSGSLSFEMIRALVERLPVMITPRWVSVPARSRSPSTTCSRYLRGGARPADRRQPRSSRSAGADRVSYGDIMREYARQRGLAAPHDPRAGADAAALEPLARPRHAALRARRPQADRQHPPRDRGAGPAAARAFAIRPRGLREAIASALRNEDAEFAPTRWSDALSAAGSARRPRDASASASRFVDSRATHVAAAAATAFAPIGRIGGKTGWYYADRLWELRGLLDLLAGGVGMRRGRRDPDELRVGDTVDCWRVETFEPDRRLRLAAEMKLPGRAWLEFEVTPDDAGSIIRQTAIFDPAGLAGLAYWYARLSAAPARLRRHAAHTRSNVRPGGRLTAAGHTRRRRLARRRRRDPLPPARTSAGPRDTGAAGRCAFRASSCSGARPSSPQ